MDITLSKSHQFTVSALQSIMHNISQGVQP